MKEELNWETSSYGAVIFDARTSLRDKRNFGNRDHPEIPRGNIDVQAWHTIIEVVVMCLGMYQSHSFS